MERNFKKEIQEAASNPIDMAEMMAQLVQVRRRVWDCSRHRLVQFVLSHAHPFELTGLTDAVVDNEENEEFSFAMYTWIQK